MKKKTASRSKANASSPLLLFLQALLILLTWKLWPALALTVLLAPALLSMARKNRLFMWSWLAAVALVAAWRLLPSPWSRYAGIAFLVPASLCGAVLLGLWNQSFRKGSKKGSGGSVSGALYAFNAFSVAALVLVHTGWACYHCFRFGTVPMMSGLLIAAVAIGVILLCVSAWTRRQPWDLLIGGVLFTLIWYLLRITQFVIFL